ncbi:MAG: HIT family protein [Burkholderiaceae bacterium]
MTASTSCVFCKILAGKLPARMVHEDEAHIAFLPLEHINPGHIVLIPRRHTDDLFDLDAFAYQQLWAVVAKLAPRLREAFSAKRVGVAVEGFNVPHVHVHLVPLHAVDELNPARGRVVDAAEADRLSQMIRDAFLTLRK